MRQEKNVNMQPGDQGRHITKALLKEEGMDPNRFISSNWMDEKIWAEEVNQTW